MGTVATQEQRATSAIEVERLEVFTDTEAVLGGNVELRRDAGRAGPQYVLPLGGWFLGRNAPIESLAISGQRGDEVVVPVTEPRPDIAAHAPYEGIPWAGRCGFSATVSLAALPAVTDLTIRARFLDGTFAVVGGLRARRKRYPAVESALSPVLVTTIGRTGSSWLVWLLGRHPELVAYRAFEYEPRIINYCMSAMTALTEPASYLQLVRGDIYGPNWWLGQDHRYAHVAHDPGFEDVLGSQHVETVVRYFGSRIGALYDEIAEREGKGGARYFVEKLLPVSRAPDLVRELYPDTRELFLVRDPRDLLASVLAYNRKQGFPSFGREQVDTDEEYVRGPLSRDLGELLKAWNRRAADARLVRYEDLVRRPARTLSGICEYLDVDGSLAELVLQDAVTSQKEGARTRHPTAPSPEASIGRWKTSLDPGLRTVAAEALEPFLEPLGYAC